MCNSCVGGAYCRLLTKPIQQLLASDHQVQHHLLGLFVFVIPAAQHVLMTACLQLVNISCGTFMPGPAAWLLAEGAGGGYPSSTLQCMCPKQCPNSTVPPCPGPLTGVTT